MGESRHTFSVYDGWMIDIFTSIGAGAVVTGVLAAIYKAVYPMRGDLDVGGAHVLLGAISLIWVLILLRRARGRRDAQAAEAEETQAAGGGRTRRGAR